MPLRFVILLAAILSCARPVGAEQSLTLIPIDATWRYHDSGQDLGTDWSDPSFDDSSWSAGPALLDNDLNDVYPIPIRTRLNYVSADEGNYIVTYYFRTHFDCPSNSPGLILRTGLLVDDGAVFYLNGVEASRLRIPPGQTSGTYATGIQLYEGYYEVIDFPKDALRIGDNVMAVEVHQGEFRSSDVAFAMTLKAVWADPVHITSQPSYQGGVKGFSTTFTIGATGARLRYQWLTNGVAIPGATNSEYAISTTQPSHSAVYAVAVSNIWGTVLSSNVSLTVVPDTFPPTMVSAELLQAQNAIDVTFSERLLPSSVANLANYSITLLGRTNPVSFSGVQQNINLLRLRGVSPWAPESNYVVTVRGVSDFASNVVVSGSRVLARSSTNFSLLWLPLGTEWRYYRDPLYEDLSGRWTQLDYDDRLWVGPGAGPFTSSNTSLSVPAGTHLDYVETTHYFRTLFVHADEASVMTLRLRFGIDDGAVFYINGKEIYRYNMPSGEITFNTFALADSPITATDPFSTTSSNIVVSNLVPGLNVLAAEVHQSSAYTANSQAFRPDLVFGTELIKVLQPQITLPPLRIVSANGNVMIFWDGAGFVLESAENIKGPWTAVLADGNSYSAGATEMRRFFRLRY